MTTKGTKTYPATADWTEAKPAKKVVEPAAPAAGAEAAAVLGTCTAEDNCEKEGYTCGAAKLGAGLLAAFAAAASL